MFDDQRHSTLALNADYSPIQIMDWRSAIGIVMRGKAHVVDEHDVWIHSPSTQMRLPAVIALNVFADHNRPAAFTRRNVFLAYALYDVEGTYWRCGLCGKIERDMRDLTFDHIVPRSRNGTSCYANICLAHSSCNAAKGSRTLQQAGMTLHVDLVHPSDRQIVLAGIREGWRSPPPEWSSFLEHSYWNVPLEA